MNTRTQWTRIISLLLCMALFCTVTLAAESPAPAPETLAGSVSPGGAIIVVIIAAIAAIAAAAAAIVKKKKKS